MQLTYMCMAESLYCAPETIITLLTTSLKNTTNKNSTLNWYQGEEMVLWSRKAKGLGTNDKMKH